MRNCNCDTDLVGIIRDRENYPYNNYTKLESDARYALKDDTAQHFETIRELIEDLVTTTNNKAEQVSLDTLYTVVDRKATKEELAVLSAAINNKAEQSTVNELSSLINNKANSSDVIVIATQVNDKVGREEFTEAMSNTITKRDIRLLFEE